jgi:hypothetical protein
MFHLSGFGEFTQRKLINPSSARRHFFLRAALAAGCILTLSLGRYGWPNLPFGPDRRDALSYLGGGAAA